MKRVKLHSRLFWIILPVLLLGWFGGRQLLANQSPATVIQRAWRQALESGVYRYTTDLTQTTQPLPTLANIGLSRSQERMYIEGQADIPARSLHMKIWNGNGSVGTKAGALELKIEHGKTFGRMGAQDSLNGWQEMDDVSSLFAPGQDPLGFLSAATDVVDNGQEQRAGYTFTRYTFELDGLAFATYMRRQLEAELTRQGKLPPGVELDMVRHYVEMTGMGELWLDEAERPLRLILHASFPPDENEQVNAEIVTTFTEWAGPALAFGQPGSVVSWLRYHLPDAQTTANTILVLAAALTLAYVVLRYTRQRQVYAAVVLSVIVSMVVIPVLQGQQVYAFAIEQNAQRLAAEEERDQRRQVEAQEAAQNKSSFDAHANPLEAATTRDMALPQAASPAAPTAQDTVSADPTITEVIDSLPLTDDGTDSDGDGLSNVREMLTRTNMQDSDSDDDGLSDGTEYLKLGTNPAADYGNDTDGDGLPDGAEVRGFSYASQQWYLDPLVPDTNLDSSFDGAECFLDTSGGSGNETLQCPDTDNDGAPNVFDQDDDNDGVADVADTSPTTAVGNLATGLADNRFRFQVGDLAPNQPVYVDFQLRPLNPAHLWYSMNVLDWPENDKEGQIQSVLNTAYGSSGREANGDMRLVPLLEIEIPFQNGHYGNLPVLAGAPAIAPTLPITAWLDTAEMNNFGITVRRKDDSGTLLAYVPLTLVREEEDNSPVAFAARMFYRPLGADWGAIQQARLVWLVEVKTDVCLPMPNTFEPGLPADQRQEKWCADLAHWVEKGPTPAHIYEDPWVLTGMSVREDRGLKTAIVFEEPTYTASVAGYTPTAFHDDNLWTLAQGLDRSFLAGRGDGNNQRTMTIEDVTNRFDRDVNGGSTAEQRWNIPANALQVQRFDFSHQAYAATLPMTHTKEILASYFTPQVNGGMQDTTLMFLREERVRSAGLDLSDLIQPFDGATFQNGALQGNGLTLRLDPAQVKETVFAGMSWVPFRYSAAGVWEAYPIEEYWRDKSPLLENTLAVTFTDPDELLGARIIAHSFYLSLYHGHGRLVEFDGKAVKPKSQLSDGEMLPYVNQQNPYVRLGWAIDNFIFNYNRLFLGVQYWTQSILSMLEDLLVRPVATSLFNVQDYEGFVKRQVALKKSPVRSVGEFYTAASLGIAPARIQQEEKSNIIHRGKPLQAALLRAGQKTVRFGSALSSGSAFLGVTAAVGQIIVTATGDIKNVRVALVFAAINTASSVIAAASAIHSVNLVLTASSLKTKMEKFLSLAKRLTNVNRFQFAFTTLLTATVLIGVFIAQVVDNNLQVGSLAYDQALIGMTATLVVAILFLLISSMPLVGQLIAALTALIDAVINLICVATGVTQGGQSVVRDYICPGISGLLTKMVASLAPIVNLEHKGRLNLTNFNMQLVDPDRGFAVGNKFRIEFDVDTALYRKPSESLSGLWFWQFGEEFMRWSTFKYQLMPGKYDLHDGLALRQMENQWARPIPGGWAADSVLRHRNTLSDTITFSQAGFNRHFPEYYLAEGHAIPAQECWLNYCALRPARDTLHLDLGTKLVFDIFPATLNEFTTLVARPNGGYVLGWMTNMATPTLADADGDGLRSPALGGNDPNDSQPDGDLDGLSDFFEIQTGSDPARADADQDGLNDATERRYRTDPFHADSDNDGLPDGEEISGWTIVYGFNGTTPLVTRVTSDPLASDIDQDDYLDSQEKAYGLHPGMPSINDPLSLISYIGGESASVRPGATVPYTVTLTNNLDNRHLLGLLSVDFPPALQNQSLAPQSFVLAPATGVTATGQVQVNPLINQSQAVSLTNIAGVVAADLNAEAAGRTSWLHLEETPGGSSIQYNDSSLGGHPAQCEGSLANCPTNNVAGFRGLALDFDGNDDFLYLMGTPKELGFAQDSYTVIAWVNADDWSGKRTFLRTNASSQFTLGFDRGQPLFEFNGSVFAAPLVLTTGRWYRVAWRYDRSRNEHAIFVDGVLQTSTTTPTFPYADLVNGGTTMGLARDGAGWSFFDGRLDEIEIFPFALTDRGLAVGTGNGQIFYSQFEHDINFADENIGWQDDSLYRNRLDCALRFAGDNYFNQCPDDQKPGFVQKAYFFGNNGEADVLQVAPRAHLDLSRGSGAFAISVWLQKQQFEGGWIMGNVNLQTGSDSGYPSLRVEGDQIEAHFGALSNKCDLLVSGLTTLADPFADQHWQHVVASFDGATLTLYLNNAPIGTAACGGKRPTPVETFYIGHRANSSSNGYRGYLDELRIFDHDLTPDQVADLFWDMLPTLELRFDEAPARSEFADQSLIPHNATCSGNTCPTSGLQGRHNQAIRLDGADDGLAVATMQELNLSGSSFTVAAWVNFADTAPQPVLGTDAGGVASNEFMVGLQGGQPLFGIGGRAYAAPNPIATNQWHHVVWRNFYEPGVTPKSHLAIFVDGTSVFTQTVNNLTVGANDRLLSVGRFTNAAGASLSSQGMLDELNIYRQALSDAQIQALYNQSPALLLHLDEASGSTSFANVANSERTFFCSGTGCPQAGVKGKQYQGLAFGGNQSVTLPHDVNLFTGASSTIGFWVKPTVTKDAAQLLFERRYDDVVIDQIQIEPNSLQITHTTRPACGAFQSLTSQAALQLDAWNHVLVTYDNQARSLYLNGRLDSRMATTGGLCQTGWTLQLGSGLHGDLDEVVVYNEALTPRDIAALVDYQRTWYDTRFGHTVQIDADRPTVAVDVSAAYLPKQSQVLAIKASDPTSGIKTVEVQVDRGGWFPATRDGEAWLFTFTPASDGSYSIDVQATDGAGNLAVSSKAVVVDGLAPLLGAVNAESISPMPVLRNDANNSWDVALHGAVEDSQSGLAAVYVSVSDNVGVPVSGRLPATLNNGQWQIAYPFPTRPNGQYSVFIEALDQVGNVGTKTVIAAIDGTAPSAAVTNPAANATSVTGPTTLAGTVSDGGVASTVTKVEIAFVPSGRNARSSAEFMTGDLLVHLPLDEFHAADPAASVTFADRAGADNPAQCTGNACPVSGLTGSFGNALHFDGVADTLTVSGLAVNLRNNAFTLGGWVYPESNTNDIHALLALTDPNGKVAHLLAYQQSTQKFIYSDGVVGNQVTTSTFAPGQWYHLLLTIDSANNGTLYVNGAAAATFSTTARPPANGQLTVGYGADDGGNNRYFQGMVDDVVLYTYAFSAAEVKRFERGFAPVLHLPLDDAYLAHNDLVADSSRYQNSVLFQHLALPESVYYPVPGIVGAGAYELNGGYIQPTPQPHLDLSDGEFTQMAWVYPVTTHGGTTDGGPIISGQTAGNPDAQRYPSLEVSGGSPLLVVSFGDGTSLTSYFTGNSLALNQWNFVAVTFDGTDYKIYINGLFKESTNLFAGKKPYPTTTFDIGRASQRFGYLDEVSIYRQVLSADEIAAFYQQGWQPTTLTGSPVGSWEYPLPAGLNGPYQIQLRSSDALGNRSSGVRGQTIWSGEIKAPTPVKATLTVIKNVVNDHGGPAQPGAFTLNVTGTNVSLASFPGASGAGTTVTLDPGPYAVTENAATGYASSFSADCTGVIASGESKSCTVTNDDVAPQLTVMMQVVNDQTGTATPDAFAINVTATDANPASFNGSASGTIVTLDAGSYSVSTPGLAGYTVTPSADCTGTLALGESKSCTLTADDNAPATGTLVVVKETVPDADPTVFSFMAGSGLNPVSFSLSDGQSQTFANLAPGTYTISEQTPSGWTLTNATCDNGSPVNMITVNASQTVTCTFLNTKQTEPPPVLVGACGGYEVYRQSNGSYTAANWNGLILVGTAGKDKLKGTSANEIILGLGGNDALEGKGGNDLLCGGDDDDTLTGNKGNEFLDGGNGNDKLNSSEGFHDALVGGEGNDILSDPDGVAAMHGGAGNDTLTVIFKKAWLSPSGDRRFEPLTGGYGDDKVKFAIEGKVPLRIDISGDERNDPPSPLDGANDELTLTGPVDSSSVIVDFEKQKVKTASASEQEDAEFAALVQEWMSGEDWVKEEQPEAEGTEAEAMNIQYFLPLVQR